MKQASHLRWDACSQGLLCLRVLEFILTAGYPDRSGDDTGATPAAVGVLDTTVVVPVALNRVPEFLDSTAKLADAPAQGPLWRLDLPVVSAGRHRGFLNLYNTALIHRAHLHLTQLDKLY